MAKKTTIELIFEDLVNAVTGIIEPKYIFTGGRPDVINSDSQVSKFVVITLPVSIEDIAVGNKKFMLTTTGAIDLFLKSKKDSTLNVNSTSEFVEQAAGLFPISGKVIAAANPKVRMRGTDEHGYQFVTITFDLHTKANVFSSLNV